MLDVFITVDTEIWCGGWDDLDARFPEAFRRYVYGPTSTGDHGLPLQLSILADHGLKASFFVEPLFSARFGRAPLAEIVGLLQEENQEIQLHCHTEWVDEAEGEDLPRIDDKRQCMHDFDRDEQARIIAAGLAYLKDVGVEGVNAFRAGGFASNADTLRAVGANGLAYDSSVNPTTTSLWEGDGAIRGPVQVDKVWEYPLTTFEDWPGHLRHVQVTACSFGELRAMLNQAEEKDYRAFVILFHNFELLTPDKSRPDPVVVGRFRRLCQFLDANRDRFRVRGFSDLPPPESPLQPTPLRSTRWRTGARVLSQLWRRRYE